ncbi:hypothetical protein SAMN04488109_4826 [Chryseolinea serpens]|uniref:Uncharacterized protein n=1 Tax=Chryseolinea serpens TaxID=947013 RepID=A0A1M5UPW0_9BACT|nr:hypothetical protein [Chryseolinea serpens]SHH64989.1 hypothetical protein SAMN04488109_4826 [Chryseolinea serpens]
MTLSAQFRQSVAFFITTGLILTLLCLYFFVYVSNREEAVTLRNFRVLGRAATNLNHKLEQYRERHIIKNYLWEKRGKIHAKDTASTKTTYKTELLKKGIIVEGLTYIKDATAFIDLELSPSKIIFTDTILVLQDSGNPQTIEKDSAYLLKASITYQNFTKGLFQDVIEDYVLLKAGSEVDPKAHPEVLFNTNTIGISDSAAISVYKNQGRRTTLNLNGTAYEVFTHPFSLAGKKCLLLGLQKETDYRDETRSIEPSLLYTLIIAALLLVLSLPMIKVIFISKVERLNKSDVIWCGLSLLLGCFLCTLTIQSLELSSSRLYEEENLDPLSKAIQHRFDAEIKNNLSILDTADASFPRYPKSIIISGGKSNLKDVPNGILRLFPDKKPSSLPNKKFRTMRIHWTDSTGMQRIKWSNGISTPPIDVSERAYFKDFDSNKAWRNPFADTTFVLESILSWTEIDPKAVLSQRSSDLTKMKVVGMTTKLLSVMDPILPPNYKFCIATKNGEVWFHSDINRNNNENIFEELGLPKTTFEQFFHQMPTDAWLYYNKEHRVKITPMRNFPLYLIVMKDLTAEETSKFYVKLVTTGLLGIQLLMVLVTVVLIRLIHKRAIAHLSLDWLKPEVKKSKKYASILWLNLFLLLLLISLFLFGVLNDLEEIFVLITLPACLLPPIFVYLNMPSYQNYYSSPRLSILLVPIVLIFLLDILASVSHGFPHFPWVVFIQIALIVIINMSLPSLRQIKEIVDKKISWRGVAWLASRVKHSPDGVLWLFTPALFSLLLLIGALPTVIFFKHSFNHERLLFTMANQLAFTQKLYKNDGTSTEGDHEIYRFGISEDETYKSETRNTLRSKQATSGFPRLAAWITGKPALTFLQNNDSLQTHFGGTLWRWTKKSNSLALQPAKSGPPPPKASVAQIPTFHLRIFPFVIGVLALVYLFFLIKVLSQCTFICNIHKTPLVTDVWLDKLLSSSFMLPELSSKEKFSRLDKFLDFQPVLIIGLSFLENNLSNAALKWFTRQQSSAKAISINFRDPSFASKSKKYDESLTSSVKTLCIIEHFEFDLNNKDLTQKKLGFLEKILSYPHVKILLFSAVHPVQLFDAFPEMEVNIKSRWHAVLARFHKVIQPLQISGYSGKVPSQFDRFINKECNHGQYLQNLKPILQRFVKQSKSVEVVELVDKIKSLAYNYYAYLWDSCSQEERYLIYDLAEDGLVNRKNVDSIKRLLSKGIFVGQGSLRLMNASFREFVLSYVNPEQALVLRENVSKDGNWNRVRLALMIVLSGVALFLLYSQKNAFSLVMGLLTAVPVLFRALESALSTIPKKK